MASSKWLLGALNEKCFPHTVHKHAQGAATWSNVFWAPLMISITKYILLGGIILGCMLEEMLSSSYKWPRCRSYWRPDMRSMSGRCVKMRTMPQRDSPRAPAPEDMIQLCVYHIRLPHSGRDHGKVPGGCDGSSLVALCGEWQVPFFCSHLSSAGWHSPKVGGSHG